MILCWLYTWLHFKKPPLIWHITHRWSDSNGTLTLSTESSWRKPKSESAEAGFGTDGWLLASGSKDKTIRIWSTNKFRQLLLLKLPNPGRREKVDDQGRSRSWLTLCWLQQNPCKIISSSQRWVIFGMRIFNWSIFIHSVCGQNFVFW